MSKKVLPVMASLFLLAACETPPAGEGGAEGTGMDGMHSGSAYPGSAAPALVEDFVANVGDRVFFAFDSSVINAEGQRTLERQASWLMKHTDVAITVEGHCDERGTREYNLALGERRATAVKNYLVSLGVAANRVNTISYGKERPAVEGHNSAAWSKNRRGVTVVH